MRGSAAAALAAALALAAPSIAAGLQRLQVPAGAAVELSDGSQRDVAQLATQVFGALNGSGGDTPTGAWCCVPVWNGRPGGELWTSVTGLSGGGSLYLSTDPACGAGACGFPIAAAAFVSLCPGTLACAAGGGTTGANATAGGAANQTSPAPGGGASPAPGTSPAPSTPVPPPAPSPQPTVRQASANASNGPGQLLAGAALPGAAPIPRPQPPSAPAGTAAQPAAALLPGDGPRLNVTVLPPEAIASAASLRAAPLAALCPGLLVAVAAALNV